jgi:hypothetical protein
MQRTDIHQYFHDNTDNINYNNSSSKSTTYGADKDGLTDTSWRKLKNGQNVGQVSQPTQDEFPFIAPNQDKDVQIKTQFPLLSTTITSKPSTIRKNNSNSDQVHISLLPKSILGIPTSQSNVKRAEKQFVNNLDNSDAIVRVTKTILDHELNDIDDDYSDGYYGNGGHGNKAHGNEGYGNGETWASDLNVNVSFQNDLINHSSNESMNSSNTRRYKSPQITPTTSSFVNNSFGLNLNKNQPLNKTATNLHSYTNQLNQTQIDGKSIRTDGIHDALPQYTLFTSSLLPFPPIDFYQHSTFCSNPSCLVSYTSVLMETNCEGCGGSFCGNCLNHKAYCVSPGVYPHLIAKIGILGQTDHNSIQNEAVITTTPSSMSIEKTYSPTGKKATPTRISTVSLLSPSSKIAAPTLNDSMGMNRSGGDNLLTPSGFINNEAHNVAPNNARNQNWVVSQEIKGNNSPNNVPYESNTALNDSFSEGYCSTPVLLQDYFNMCSPNRNGSVNTLHGDGVGYDQDNHLDPSTSPSTLSKLLSFVRSIATSTPSSLSPNNPLNTQYSHHASSPISVQEILLNSQGLEQKFITPKRDHKKDFLLSLKKLNPTVSKSPNNQRKLCGDCYQIVLQDAQTSLVSDISFTYSPSYTLNMGGQFDDEGSDVGDEIKREIIPENKNNKNNKNNQQQKSEIKGVRILTNKHTINDIQTLSSSSSSSTTNSSTIIEDSHSNVDGVEKSKLSDDKCNQNTQNADKHVDNVGIESGNHIHSRKDGTAEVESNGMVMEKKSNPTSKIMNNKCPIIITTTSPRANIQPHSPMVIITPHYIYDEKGKKNKKSSNPTPVVQHITLNNVDNEYILISKSNLPPSPLQKNSLASINENKRAQTMPNSVPFSLTSHKPSQPIGSTKKAVPSTLPSLTVPVPPSPTPQTTSATTTTSIKNPTSDAVISAKVFNLRGSDGAPMCILTPMFRNKKSNNQNNALFSPNKPQSDKTTPQNWTITNPLGLMSPAVTLKTPGSRRGVKMNMTLFSPTSKPDPNETKSTPPPFTSPRLVINRVNGNDAESGTEKKTFNRFESHSLAMKNLFSDNNKTDDGVSSNSNLSDPVNSFDNNKKKASGGAVKMKRIKSKSGFIARDAADISDSSFIDEKKDDAGMGKDVDNQRKVGREKNQNDNKSEKENSNQQFSSTKIDNSRNDSERDIENINPSRSEQTDSLGDKTVPLPAFTKFKSNTR